MACTTARTVETRQQPCRRECMLLGKRANNGMSISFSHIRNHKVQQVNLQWKRVFWPEGNCMVRLRLSTKAIKTLKTKVLTHLPVLKVISISNASDADFTRNMCSFPAL